MASIQQVIDLACSSGFEFVAMATADALQPRPEVRDMCAANMCHSYGKNWTCPPAVGTLEEFVERMAPYSDVVVFQTVQELEDEFDFETMMEAEQLHKQRLEALVDAVREVTEDFLPLGVGACTVCPECTCPDEPCRHPERQIPSMEAAGIVVSDACKAADIPYNHGSDHICYVSCILV